MAASQRGKRAFSRGGRGKIPQYSNKLEQYAATITQFYNSYAEDKQVPIFMLLDRMSDSSNLSIRQMHQYYGPETPHK